MNSKHCTLNSQALTLHQALTLPTKPLNPLKGRLPATNALAGSPL